MRIATIATPIRFANVGNCGLGVVVFDLERSNQRILKSAARGERDRKRLRAAALDLAA